MFLLIVSYFLIIIFGLLILLGKLLYYKLYPERETLEKLAKSKKNSTLVLSGNNGKPGNHGIDKSKALNGLNGNNGSRGNHGVSGEKSIQIGKKGSSGKNGSNGLNGLHGNYGEKGPPSNAIVPLVIKTYDNVYRLSPVTVEHDFSVDDERYKLSATFVFDEISFFNFEHGKNNEKFCINTNDSNIYPPIPLADGNGRKIYGTIRFFLEKSENGSDGTSYYLSPPILRNGYLLVAKENLGKDLVINENLNEKIIGINRTFGLDFETKEFAGGDNFYNYFIGGLFGYKTIINISPPLLNFNFRLVENTSSDYIGNGDSCLPQFKFPAKGGAIKIKKDNKILLISPKLPVGSLIVKDSSNSDTLWETTSYRDFPSYFKNDPINTLIGAFDYMESDINSFTSGLLKASSSLVLSDYISPPCENMRAYTIKAGNESGNFSTTALIKNIKIIYPNTPFPLTYPTALEGSTFYVEFFTSTNRKDFSPFKYRILLLLASEKIIERNAYGCDFLVVSPLNSSVASPENRYLETDLNENIYHSVKIDGNKSLPFEKLFGRRILFNLSGSSIDFDARVGGEDNYYLNSYIQERIPNDYPDPSSPEYQSIQLFYTRLRYRFPGFDLTGREDKNCLAAVFRNTDYDFIKNEKDTSFGWEFGFSGRSFSVANSFFNVGYRTPNGELYTQHVFGRSQSNGDCYLDIPIGGYSLSS